MGNIAHPAPRATDTPLDLAALTHQTFVTGRAASGGAAQSTRIVKLMEDLPGTPLRADGFPARLTRGARPDA